MEFKAGALKAKGVIESKTPELSGWKSFSQVRVKSIPANEYH